MDKFIKTVEVFDEKTCRTIIDTYESSKNKERIDNVSYTTVYTGKLKCFSRKRISKIYTTSML